MPENSSTQDNHVGNTDIYYIQPVSDDGLYDFWPATPIPRPLCSPVFMPTLSEANTLAPDAIVLTATPEYQPTDQERTFFDTIETEISEYNNQAITRRSADLGQALRLYKKLKRKLSVRNQKMRTKLLHQLAQVKILSYRSTNTHPRSYRSTNTHPHESLANVVKQIKGIGAIHQCAVFLEYFSGFERDKALRIAGFSALSMMVLVSTLSLAISFLGFGLLNLKVLLWLSLIHTGALVNLHNLIGYVTFCSILTIIIAICVICAHEWLGRNLTKKGIISHNTIAALGTMFFFLPIIFGTIFVIMCGPSPTVAFMLHSLTLYLVPLIISCSIMIGLSLTIAFCLNQWSNFTTSLHIELKNSQQPTPIIDLDAQVAHRVDGGASDTPNNQESNSTLGGN